MHPEHQQAPTTVYLVFDERMTLHRPLENSNQNYPKDEVDEMPFENSSRITCLHHKLLQLEDRLRKSAALHTSSDPQTPPKPTFFGENRFGSEIPPLGPRRFLPITATMCPRSIIELAHSARHYDSIYETHMLPDEELLECGNGDSDLYFCRDTFVAASLSCGGVVQCVDAVLKSRESGIGPTRAIALVRPPGHHATRDAAMGFCFFNNVAVAAKYAVHTGRARRVFILDWDIHHGNGIQDITYDDPSIYYLSIHRGAFGSSGWFYPGTGKPCEVGKGLAVGTNLNIAWNHSGMGNPEYAMAFGEVVLPVLKSFNPDLILVACGFDAADGDLLGDCLMTPDMYYIMTKSLLETAGVDIPLVMALEGGYDLGTIKNCMEATALALLDEPYTEPRQSCSNEEQQSCLQEEKMDLTRYWKHENFFEPDNQTDTMRSAIAAVKKSVKSLVNKRREFTKRYEVGRLKLSKTALASLPSPIQPLYHRPFQDGCYPQEKRKFYQEMEVAASRKAMRMLGSITSSHRPCRNEEYPLKKRKYEEQETYAGSVV